jgi:hypothetical protein
MKQVSFGSASDIAPGMAESKLSIVKSESVHALAMACSMAFRAFFCALLLTLSFTASAHPASEIDAAQLSSPLHNACAEDVPSGAAQAAELQDAELGSSLQRPSRRLRLPQAVVQARTVQPAVRRLHPLLPERRTPPPARVALRAPLRC